MVQQAQPGP